MDWIIEKDRISVQHNGTIAAEILFPETTPGVCCITHTFVDDSLRGQGIAGKLVEKAAEVIRSRNCQITATCSYAKAWLEKHSV